MTMRQLMDLFFEGAEEGWNGSKTSPGSLRIKKNYLIHYSTTIAERREGKSIIINLTRYSLQTGKVQKMLKEAIGGREYIVVKKVPKDYCGSLEPYINRT